MGSYLENRKVTGKQIGNAIVSSLFLVILNIFIMPFNIWLGATERLSNLRESGIISEMRKTELIVLSWLKLLFDSIIFLVYILAPILIIIEIVIALSSPYMPSFGIMVFGILSSLVTIYFSTIILSFIKEIISIVLIQVTKTERIEENTRKNIP